MKTQVFIDPRRQLTNQGALKTMVQFRDKVTFQYLFYKKVPRAFLAKMYHEQRVTHAIDGIPVIDI